MVVYCEVMKLVRSFEGVKLNAKIHSLHITEINLDGYDLKLHVNTDLSKFAFCNSY